MKSILLITTFLALGASALAPGQNTGTANDQVRGRGRGGVPYAWNDKDKDGRCDLTGKPVGQGQGAAAAIQRRGRGRWGAAGQGGRGPGRCLRAQQVQSAESMVQK
jgi:hypothetical protein